MTATPATTFARATLITCLFLCLPSTVAIGPPQETAEQFVERVKKAIENDEWGRAKSGLRHALVLEPKSAESHFLSAQVYQHEGARSMAIDSLGKAIEYQPVYPEAHFLLAQCLLEAGKPDKGREELNIAIAQGASLFPAYRLLAEIDQAKGDFEAAIASLETALRFAPTAADEDAARLREQIEQSRACFEWQKRFEALEAGQKAPDIVRAVPLNSPQPIYTQYAREQKIQGAVLMGVLVSETGGVDAVLIFRGLGHGLDEQAIKVAREMKFAPAKRGGKTIPFWIKLTVEFNLR